MRDLLTSLPLHHSEQSEEQTVLLAIKFLVSKSQVVCKTRLFHSHYIIVSNSKLTSFSTRELSLLRLTSRTSCLILFMKALPQYWWGLQVGQWLPELPPRQATIATLTGSRSQVSLDFIKLICNMVESKDTIEKKHWWPKRWTIINAKSETKELLDPTDLTRAQTLCIHKLSTVVKTN